MEKIPTAEEFLPDTEIWDFMTSEKIKVRKAMVEFAKLHVKAALENALENAESINGGNKWIDPQSILSAYPLENIK